ncbi:multicopper oxidase domain-containing protein [Mariniluteicoccus flavus]
MRDRPSVVWLVLAAVVALVHRFVPDARWLMVHMVVLGALSHNVMVWSAHFTHTLLKVGGDDRRGQNWRLGLLQAGTVLVLLGVPLHWWPLTAAGAAVIAGSVLWHGITLVRLLRKALPARFRVSVHYYVAAACWLPVGATLGAILARDLGVTWHGRLLVAHTLANLFGWIGLTVVGTLLTLWPTILRTRMDDRALGIVHQLLAPMVVAVGVIVVGAAIGQRPLALGGVLVYLVCLLAAAWPMVTVARTKPPVTFSALSVASAYAWLLVGVVVLAVTLARSGTWGAVGDSYGPVTAIMVGGFAVQILLGALTYLLPVVLGGGPSVIRAAVGPLESRGVLRVTLVNGGLALWLLPTPSLVKVLATVAALAGLIAFLPLMVQGLRAGVRAKLARAEGVPAERVLVERPKFAVAEMLAGVLVLAVVTTIGVAVDPGAAGLRGTSAAVTGTGQTTTVKVEARGMRFVPDRVVVPKGNRLVIELVNADPTNVHDLVLASGAHSGRLEPGKTATVDVGVVTASSAGWCSVVGHRQMGMVFAVEVEGEPGAAAGAPAAGSGADHGSEHGGAHGSGSAAATGAAADLDFMKKPADSFQAVDPVLPALTPEKVRKVRIVAKELELEVAPGVKQLRWTFNGQVPGPTLHGRVGDRFEVTFVNEGTMGHSIDFHASEVAPDQPMRTIPPGQSLTYDFTANRAGIWMYHCSTMPMSSHIAAGMHGAVVIEPEGLAPAPSFVMVQSEIYLGERGGAVNADKIKAQAPDALAFNGVASQYDHRPLSVRVGERVRFWVLDAGPNKPSAFHIVGTQFDTVYSEGAYQLRQGRDAFGQGGGGSQALGLQAAQGGFVETVFAEPGRYPMVSHIMSDAEKGAHGFVVAR